METLLPPTRGTTQDRGGAALASVAADGHALIEDLLGAQGNLSAVERFAQFHEESVGPLQSRFYSALLPASPPGPGQQLAFEVDLDRCSGCKACVVACHTLNGLDEGEAWRDVGLLVGGRSGLPVLQHVTSSCHHCLDPACLAACPTDAYEKDPVTGIVKHLDDQCFGCQYCTLACPYDAPKFHAGKGIVRKCDMCSGRLAVGEAPACVQACPHEAIRIRVVDRDDVAERAEAGDFLIAAPGPDHTRPTTRYLSARPLPDSLRPGDHFRNHPEHAHWPLVLMLVLTQLSVGAFLVDLLIRASSGEGSPLRIAACLGFGLLGLMASTCHLGRPHLAFRAIIGIRHSWLSREVAAFGLFAGLAKAHAGLTIVLPWLYDAYPALRLAVGAGVVASGALGVACSVMVYHVVRRPFWRATLGVPKFAGTGLVLGLALTLAVSAVDGTSAVVARTVGLGLMVAIVAKLRFEGSMRRHLEDPNLTPLKRSALLITGPLSRASAIRVTLGILGGLVLPFPLILGWTSLPGTVAAAGAILAFLALVGGEVAERYLFFAAVVKPKMPGGLLP